LALSFWSAAKPTANSQQPKSNSQQPSWLLLGLFFAAGTEGLQYFLPWRAFNLNDLLANGLGILVGFALLLLINIRKRGWFIDDLQSNST
jgi:VanZ family protein